MPRDPQTGKFVGADVLPPASGSEISPSEKPPENSTDPVEPGDTANVDPGREAAALLNDSPTRDPDATLVSVPGSVESPPEQTKNVGDPEAPYGRLKNGKPRKTPPKGMPRVSPPNARPIIAVPATVEAKPAGIPDHQILAIAGICNAGFFVVLQSLMGEEAKASNDEKKLLNEALADYLKMKDAPMTPELALFVAYTSIIITRAEKPTVREKIAQRASTIWVRFKGWRAARKQAKTYVEGSIKDGSEPPRNH